MWRSQNNLQKWILFFHHIHSGHQTQVIRVGSRYHYPHAISPALMWVFTVNSVLKLIRRTSRRESCKTQLKRTIEQAAAVLRNPARGSLSCGFESSLEAWVSLLSSACSDVVSPSLFHNREHTHQNKPGLHALACSMPIKNPTIPFISSVRQYTYVFVSRLQNGALPWTIVISLNSYNFMKSFHWKLVGCSTSLNKYLQDNCSLKIQTRIVRRCENLQGWIQKRLVTSYKRKKPEFWLSLSTSDSFPTPLYQKAAAQMLRGRMKQPYDGDIDGTDEDLPAWESSADTLWIAAPWHHFQHLWASNVKTIFPFFFRHIRCYWI